MNTSARIEKKNGYIGQLQILSLYKSTKHEQYIISQNKWAPVIHPCSVPQQVNLYIYTYVYVYTQCGICKICATQTPNSHTRARQVYALMRIRTSDRIHIQAYKISGTSKGALIIDYKHNKYPTRQPQYKHYEHNTTQTNNIFNHTRHTEEQDKNQEEQQTVIIMSYRNPILKIVQYTYIYYELNGKRTYFTLAYFCFHYVTGACNDRTLRELLRAKYMYSFKIYIFHSSTQSMMEKLKEKQKTVLQSHKEPICTVQPSR